MDSFTVWMVTDGADNEWAEYFGNFKAAQDAANELNKAVSSPFADVYVVEEIEVKN